MECADWLFDLSPIFSPFSVCFLFFLTIILPFSSNSNPLPWTSYSWRRRSRSIRTRQVWSIGTRHYLHTRQMQSERYSENVFATEKVMDFFNSFLFCSIFSIFLYHWNICYFDFITLYWPVSMLLFIFLFLRGLFLLGRLYCPYEFQLIFLVFFLYFSLSLSRWNDTGFSLMHSL